MAKCLVTGGAGFIGGHLARKLIALEHEVTIVDDNTNSTAKDAPSEADFYREDISYIDLVDLHFIDYDVLFHCAAVSRTPPAVKAPLRCMAVNVTATHGLLEAVRQDNPKCRFVFSSSNIVYAGDTAYKVSKLAAEGLCKVYASLYGLSTISLRYSNVYGPCIKEGDCAVFASLRDSARKNGYIEITGDGTQTRDFTHVDDIVRANLLAWEHTELSGVEPIDICTGVNTSLLDIAEYFKKSGRAVDVRFTGERTGDVKHIHQSPDRAAELLGWKPEIVLADGIDSIWQITR